MFVLHLAQFDWSLNGGILAIIVTTCQIPDTEQLSDAFSAFISLFFAWDFPVMLQIHLMSCRLRVGCYGHEELLGFTYAGKRLANPAMLSRRQIRVQRKLKFIPTFMQVGNISMSLSRMYIPCLKISPCTNRAKPRTTLVCNVIFGRFEHARDAREWKIVTYKVYSHQAGILLGQRSIYNSSLLLLRCCDTT